MTITTLSFAGMNTKNITSKGKVIAIKKDRLKLKSNGGTIFYAKRKNVLGNPKVVSVGTLVTVRENYSNLLKEYKKNKKK